MDKKLLNLVSKQRPEFNPRLKEGVVEAQMASIEDDMRRLLHNAAIGFPKGLQFVELTRCLPFEAFCEITRPLKDTADKPSRLYDLALSDIYLVKILFRYKGQMLRPRYVYFPYSRRAGEMYLKGTMYQILMVTSGQVFNIEGGDIYLPLPRAKLGFKQFPIGCLKNGSIVNGTAIYSHLWVLTKTLRSKHFPCLLHYLLAEAGLVGAFKKYFHLDIIVGDAQLKTLDSDIYNVYSSRQMESVAKRTGNIVPKLHVAVEKSKWTKTTDSLIATLFYIVDVNSCALEDADLEDREMWLLLLDRHILKVPDLSNKRIVKLHDHMRWVATALDEVTKLELASLRVNVNNLFELMAHLTENYRDVIIHHDAGSMYNTVLGSSKYVMYDIIKDIFTTAYKMRDLEQLPENEITAAKIEKILMEGIKKEAIYKATGHGELVPFNQATLCIQHGRALDVIAHGDTGGRAGKSPQEDEKLHPSQGDCAMYMWSTKKCPTARGHLNNFANTAGYKLVPSRHMRESVKILRELLPR